ncbi:serine protease [Pseudoramibacter alactolyticus]|uniref:SDH family Clp fold serine proteinase n=1 Tax=Pseudoramibacter alactolyticus TaxID=113287 RepID=UPI0028F1256C|nr:serine protease [Pseudoramibacter alactolyticus]
MAGWDEVLKEINEAVSPMDYVRRRHLKKLSELTRRNIIAYYSSWLTKPDAPNSDINDSDMAGFMNAIKTMDCSKGLDLILHTPGGSPLAAEGIVKYLRSKFQKNIRIIVPQLAMSAGTMIACSGKEIVMGNHSSLGPIDPQINGIPAYNIKMEFEEAKSDLSNHPENANYWAMQLQKYPPAYVKSAIDAIELSGELIKDWLSTNMFDTDSDLSENVEKVVTALNQHDDSKLHGRHFTKDYCKDIGLKIVDLEENATFQDAVLTVHHAFMIMLANGPTIKIIENQDGKAFINNIQG